MKINIIEKFFSVHNLDYCIWRFEKINNVTAYLIMNSLTLNMLSSEFCSWSSPNNPGKYKGKKIFINNDLNDGEIDIR